MVVNENESIHLTPQIKVLLYQKSLHKLHENHEVGHDNRPRFSQVHCTELAHMHCKHAVVAALTALQDNNKS